MQSLRRRPVCPSEELYLRPTSQCRSLSLGGADRPEGGECFWEGEDPPPPRAPFSQQGKEQGHTSSPDSPLLLPACHALPHFMWPGEACKCF